MVERLFLIEAMPQGMGGCMTSVDVVSVDGGYSKCNKCYRGYSGGCCKLTNATKQQGVVLDAAGRLSFKGGSRRCVVEDRNDCKGAPPMLQIGSCTAARRHVRAATRRPTYC